MFHQLSRWRRRGEVFGIEKEPFTSFMFAHFGGPEFAARIYELADRTCSLLLWTSGPDGDYLGVTQPDYLPLAQAVIPDEEIAVFRDLDHMASLMGRWILTPKRYITCA